MSTIETNGIVWNCRNYESRVAYFYKSFLIFYSKEDRQFQVWNKEELLFAHRDAGLCLKEATFAVLEMFADKLTPSWKKVA